MSLASQGGKQVRRTSILAWGRDAARRPGTRAGFGLGLVSLAVATNVFAADPVQRPVPLPAIGRTAATNPDSTTIIQNPANLGVLPGAELRWTGEFLDDRALIPSQGNAVGLAFRTAIEFCESKISSTPNKALQPTRAAEPNSQREPSGSGPRG